jgi:hypothetical protein
LRRRGRVVVVRHAFRNTKPDDPRAQRLIEGAMQGAKRGSSLTQRMLAFARQQELKTILTCDFSPYFFGLSLLAIHLRVSIRNRERLIVSGFSTNETSPPRPEDGVDHLSSTRLEPSTKTLGTAHRDTVEKSGGGTSDFR